MKQDKFCINTSLLTETAEYYVVKSVKELESNSA